MFLNDKKISSRKEEILTETFYLESGGYKEAESYFAFCMSQLLAGLLFDDRGTFRPLHLQELSSFLPETRIYHIEYKKFVIDKISLIQTEKPLQTYFARLTLPMANPWIEEMVRSSLYPPPPKLTDRLLKVAVLAATLCPLRQNIGSCFATATCLFVQHSQYELLIKDLFDLVTMGFLRKTGEEGELRVPAAVLMGKGDLLQMVKSGAQLSFHIGWVKALQELSCLDQATELQKPLEEFSRWLKIVSPEGKTHDLVFRQIVEMKAKKNLSAKDVEAWERILSHFSQNLLLKMWEYTVASFVDGFSRYTKNHLIIALGLEQHEPLGVGKTMYDALQFELDAMNQKLEENAREINALRDKISVSEKLLQKADSDDKYRRLKAELEYCYQKEAFLLHEREIDSGIAHKITELYALLCEQIAFHLPLYFVEVYDPSLLEKNQRPFEDGAAGFRLVYKHGRADPSVWTIIHSAQDCKKFFQEFFIALEQVIRPQIEGPANQLLHKVSQKIHALLLEEEFYIAAKQRMENFEAAYPSGKQILTIWSYLSGGTLHSLLHGYFGLSKNPSEEVFSPANPKELCLELIEWMKEAPYKICEEVKKDPSQGFLFYSPRHVFLFQPGHPSFANTWDNREFTYTYLRDRFVDSNKEFYDQIRLRREEQQYLYFLACQKGLFSPTHEKLFVEGATLSEFTREHLEGLTTLANSLFFNHLPLVTLQEVRTLFPSHPDVKTSLLSNVVDLKQWIVKESVLGRLNEQDAIQKALHAHLLPPAPFIFADSNWHQTKFAFVTDPVAGEMSLWRVSASGLLGEPMLEWQEDFGNKKPPNLWGLLTKREELFVDLREIKTRR